MAGSQMSELSVAAPTVEAEEDNGFNARSIDMGAVDQQQQEEDLGDRFEPSDALNPIARELKVSLESHN